MRTTDPGDAARIELLLAELRLPAIKLVWASLATQADKEGWPAARSPVEPSYFHSSGESYGQKLVTARGGKAAYSGGVQRLHFSY